MDPTNTVTPSTIQSTERRKPLFSPQALNDIIAKTLPADAQPGDKVLVGTVNQDGVAIVASFAFGDGWQLKGAAQLEWGGDYNVGASIIKRF